ncbi:MAG TPA: hypothetical protein VIW69_04885 [Candidatus Elarobacter sp.]
MSNGDTMRTIFIIRHGEKPTDPNPGSTDPTIGITADGSPNGSSLTPFGWQRAGALAGLFAPYASSARANLLTPGEMYSPSYSDDPKSGTISTHRTNETIFALSQVLGLTVDNTTYAEGGESAMGGALAGEQSAIVTLVCWEHTAIPTIANAIVGSSQQSQIPQTWPDDRYDVVWAFTRMTTSDQYSFVQYPEMLLYGDSATTIPVSSSSSSSSSSISA